MNIFLIDDDNLFLLLTERILQKAPFLEKIESRGSVEEAKTYLDSREASKEAFPDVIFVDMNMPEMTGMEFAEYYSQRYAAAHPQTKLIILTSSISRKEKMQAMEIPVVEDCMQKPLTEKMLRSLLPPTSRPARKQEKGNEAL